MECGSSGASNSTDSTILWTDLITSNSATDPSIVTGCSDAPSSASEAQLNDLGRDRSRREVGIWCSNRSGDAGVGGSFRIAIAGVMFCMVIDRVE